MAFQGNAFQNNAFQIPRASPVQNSGGYREKKKFDSEAYAYVYNNADRLRQRVEALPEPVKEVVQELIPIQSPVKRKALLKYKLQEIDLQFQLMYLELLEQAHNEWLDEQLRLELLEAERRQDEEDIILLLLMS